MCIVAGTANDIVQQNITGSIFVLERFNLTLTPAPGSAFYHGGIYSDQICFPLPEVEYLNNPNITR